MAGAVEILAVGDELLDGLTQDTNTHWLCREMTGLGGAVRRATVVRDDPGAIAGEVKSARARGTALLLVTGGLGPTSDDLTLEGVARAAGVVLAENEAARQMVAARYESLRQSGEVSEAGLSPERLKMARLPQGAEPIENPVGAAPAVLLGLDGTEVVCLPGVPAELKAIFAGPLQPLIQSVLGVGSSRDQEVLVRLNDESAMATALHEVAVLFPDVYIKSHARDFRADHGIRVTLSARGADSQVVGQRIEAAAQAVRDRLPTL